MGKFEKESIKLAEVLKTVAQLKWRWGNYVVRQEINQQADNAWLAREN